MPDPVKDYETASRGFADVLAQGSDDLSRPSPCEGWTAKDVVDHVLGGPRYYTEKWGGQAPDVPDDAPLVERYRTEAAALAETCRQPGVLDQLIDSPFGEGQMPVAVMFGILTSDTLIHTWDLARAVGVDVTLDEDLLQRTIDGLKPMEDMVRRPGVFGPPVEIDEGAPFQDRAMAWLGRQP